MPWKETCIMEQRVKFVIDYEESEESVSELCRWYGISRKTGHKWLARYRGSGIGGLGDRSRAPHHCPHAMAVVMWLEASDLAPVRRPWRKTLASIALLSGLTYFGVAEIHLKAAVSGR